MADTPVGLNSVVPDLEGDGKERCPVPLQEKPSFQALHAEVLKVLQQLQEVHEQEMMDTGRPRKKQTKGRSTGKRATKSYMEKDEAEDEASPLEGDGAPVVALETQAKSTVLDVGKQEPKLSKLHVDDVGDPRKSAISKEKLHQMVDHPSGRDSLTTKPISRVWSFVEAEVKPLYAQAKSYFAKEDEEKPEKAEDIQIVTVTSERLHRTSGPKALDQSNSCRASLEGFVNHTWFKAACIIVIIANVLHLGLQSDWQIRTSASNGGDVEGVHPLDYFFATWFTMEILLRIFAKGLMDFFCKSKERWWNFLDTIIALEALVGLMIRLTYPSFTHIRILGVFRLARLVHPMKQVKEFRKLAKTLLALFTTLRDLFSAFMMVSLFLYVYSIFLSTATVEYFGALGDVTALEDDDFKQMEEVRKCFGSIPATMLSLWSAISGGNDWMGYAELLESMSGGGRFYYWSFILFTAFWTIGLSNVVTGLVVEAVTAAVNELRSETDVIESFHDRKITEEEDLEKLTSLLSDDAKMDSHRDHVSLKELEKHLYDEKTGGKAQAFWLTKMQMTHHQVMDLYKLYQRLQPKDSDVETQGVELKGLLKFARKCQGQASYVDLLTLMHDHTRLEKVIQNEFKDMRLEKP